MLSNEAPYKKGGKGGGVEPVGGIYLAVNGRIK